MSLKCLSIILCSCLMVSDCSEPPRQDSDTNLIKSVLITVESIVTRRDWPVIFPGTKWCGKGNIAKDENDYGRFEEPDKCCKQHDYCPCLIPRKSTRYGLTNDAEYTRLHCDCDEKFLNCLKNVPKDSLIADTIGIMYFDVIKTKCFDEVPKKNRTSKPPVCNDKTHYQWYDVPSYVKSNVNKQETSEDVDKLIESLRKK